LYLCSVNAGIVWENQKYCSLCEPRNVKCYHSVKKETSRIPEFKYSNSQRGFRFIKGGINNVDLKALYLSKQQRIVDGLIKVF